MCIDEFPHTGQVARLAGFEQLPKRIISMDRELTDPIVCHFFYFFYTSWTSPKSTTVGHYRCYSTNCIVQSMHGYYQHLAHGFLGPKHGPLAYKSRSKFQC